MRAALLLFLVFPLGLADAAVDSAFVANDPFLDTLQHRTFRFFWDTTNPENGLAVDRYPTRSFSSVAALGFALTSYPIGIQRGYVTHDAAAERVLTTLRFLWKAPQRDHPVAAGHKGFFYHFLDMQTGLRFERVELSTIDTALLLAGILMCQSYFDGPSPREEAIRAYADSLYRRVDWTWAQPRPPLISLGWYPEKGFHPMDWRGYNEAMIMYLLALGSPTHPIEPEAWTKWTETYVWAPYGGQEFVSFGPLFGHQYSHCWIDFRGLQDEYMKAKGIDYFENSRRATLSQREYAIRNPLQWKDYSAEIWGLTACDGPHDTSFVIDGRLRQFRTYAARGVSFDWSNDDGTIAPTAAGGSLPFAPEVCLDALKAMRERYGDLVWNDHGFVDAFNRTYVTSTTGENGWFDVDQLGIDQGPILIMAENLRSGMVWEIMKKNPYIVAGLRRAGFAGGWLDGRSPR
ncbi:MAG: Tat pathway signal protein [Bacteroidetes bacterium]|nr:Tat pathway signal protein [Bacteroidota bacterium]